ncbi:30S ribosomal protein S21 [archaeon]|nr:30S ribosomal protein S21 [archaeon]
MERNKKKRYKGLHIIVENNNVERALKIFKQNVKDCELMLEIKRKSFYQKPSEKRRHKKNMAMLREKYKKMKENQEFRHK